MRSGPVRSLLVRRLRRGPFARCDVLAQRLARAPTALSYEVARTATQVQVARPGRKSLAGAISALGLARAYDLRYEPERRALDQPVARAVGLPATAKGLE